MNFGALNGVALNGSPLDAAVRSFIVGNCFAACAPASTYRPPLPTWVMEAQATVTPRMMSRSAGLYQASADLTLFSRLMSRSVVSGAAEASASPTASVVQLTEWRSPIYGQAEAVSTPTLHFKSVSPVMLYGYAEAVIDTHYKARGTVAGTAEAVGYINSSDPIRYKFDYPSDIRIVVPYVNNQFTVR